MSLSIYGTIASFTIPAAGTWYVDLDTDSIDNNLQILTVVTMASSAGTTGVTCNLYAGFGGSDSSVSPTSFPCISSTIGSTVPEFGDNVAQAVSMTAVTASQTTSRTYRTSFFLNQLSNTFPRWVRFKFVNTDVTNPADIVIRADA